MFGLLEIYLVRCCQPKHRQSDLATNLALRVGESFPGLACHDSILRDAFAPIAVNGLVGGE